MASPKLQALVVLSLVVSATAQRPALPEQGPTARTGRPALFDRVVAIVGQKVFLMSDVDKAVAAAPPSPTPLPLSELRERALNQLTTDEVWVQHGELAGSRRSAEFEELIDRRVRAELEEDVRRFGSHGQMTEEIGLIGTNWEALREDKKKEMLSNLGRSEAMRLRYQFRDTLLVTPRRMRQLFDVDPEAYGRPTTTTIEWVAVASADRPLDEAAVEEIMKFWAANDWTAIELAAKFEGKVRALSPFLPFALDHPNPRQEVRTVAFATEVGGVRAIRLDGAQRLIKVTDRTEGTEARFEDPAVQAFLRQRIGEALLNQRRLQALTRSQRRLFYWRTESLR